ncbi:ABC transporter permease [Prescottella sp. R16]|uniref:ABC transporter permease n=1 Tax=Prescottella sp. R16 TaxID=3064529 RepID=UPI00272EA9F1|nr:ABC transporter permease [Prescottella sp. R16]
MSLFVARALVLVAIVAAWHAVTTLDLVPPVLSRTPADVWGYLTESASNGELMEATRATMAATLAAFALASVVGVVAGISIGLLPRVEKVISPYVDAINAMPRIALAPVFIIYFGIGTSAKVALGFSIAVFLIMASAQAGVKSVDPEVLRLAKVLNATKRQVFTKILFPVAIPSIFSGLRLGFIYSLLGVVTSEIIGARVGLGQLTIHYSGLFRMEAIYGILLVLAVIASVINVGMRLIENRILRWQQPADK